MASCGREQLIVTAHEHVGGGCFGTGKMQGIEILETERYQFGRSRGHRSIRQLRFWSSVKPLPDSGSSLGNWILVVLQVVCASSDQLHLAGRGTQDRKDRLAFQMNAWLRLVVEWSFQAADIEIDFHVTVLLLLRPAHSTAEPSATDTRSHIP